VAVTPSAFADLENSGNILDLTMDKLGKKKRKSGAPPTKE